MKTLIALSTRNNITWLKECLTSIQRYSDLDKNDLFVYDACCSDGTSAFLDENNVDCLHAMVNISPIKSTNIFLEFMLQNKNIKYLALVHDDMIFTTDWLKIMIEEFEQQKDCYCMGCLSVQHKKAFMIPDERRCRIGKQLKEDFTGRAGAPMLLISRECIEKIGLFDEGYGWGEVCDNDYYRRIENAGKRFLLTHKAVIFHGEKTTRLNEPRAIEDIPKSKEYFLKKYPGIDFMKYGDKVFSNRTTDGEIFKLWGAK